MRIPPTIERLFPLFAPLALAAGASAQSTAYTVDGAAGNDRFGAQVAVLGDVDGDGCADFAVGAAYSGPSYGTLSVHSGRDRSVLWSVAGNQTDEFVGAAVAAVGDVDQDGVPDVLVGAPGRRISGLPCGVARLHSGADGSLIHTFKGAPTGEAFGASLACAGDVDGDLVPDFFVADPAEDLVQVNGDVTPDGGAVYQYSGATGALLLRRVGWEADMGFGTTLCGELDLDGDGELEYLVGAPDYGSDHRGVVLLFSAETGLWIHTVEGAAQLRFGRSACALEDFTGDGLMDVAVGSSGNSMGGTSAGAVFVYRELGMIASGAVYGGAGSCMGWSVASAGDLDGDGRTDVWAGAPTALPLLGAPGSVGAWSIHSGSPIALFHGPQDHAEFGRAVAAGDFNGDGTLDLLAGAPGDTPAGPHSGSVRLALMADAAGFPDCFGDGSASACPCGASDSELHAGCPNSTGSAGKLAATGSAHISDDTVELQGSGMPNSTCLYFQGAVQVNGGAGVPFGDGLRCAGGAVTRLGTRVNVAGASSFPGAAGPSLAQLGGAQAGETLHYQVWYRDNAPFCTSGTHSFTNSYALDWRP